MMNLNIIIYYLLHFIMNAADDEVTTMNTKIVVFMNNVSIIIIINILLRHNLTKEGIHCSISYLPQTLAVEYSTMFLKH